MFLTTKDFSPFPGSEKFPGVTPITVTYFLGVPFKTFERSDWYGRDPYRYFLTILGVTFYVNEWNRRKDPTQTYTVEYHLCKTNYGFRYENRKGLLSGRKFNFYYGDSKKYLSVLQLKIEWRKFCRRLTKG